MRDERGARGGGEMGRQGGIGDFVPDIKKNVVS